MDTTTNNNKYTVFEVFVFIVGWGDIGGRVNMNTQNDNCHHDHPCLTPALLTAVTPKPSSPNPFSVASHRDAPASTWYALSKLCLHKLHIMNL